METASVASSPKIIRIGIECEAFSDHGGIARLLTKLLRELANRSELSPSYRFRLYFKSAVPNDVLLKNPIFEPIRVWSLGSFSLYYYVFLPLLLWWDRPLAMYWPNYMLPIINPPFVPSLVMLTEDIFQEARNPQLGLRYQIAYWVFATGWAKWFATRFMAISASSKAALQKEGIAPKRIVANPLGVDIPTVVRPMDGKYLLFVGQAFERRHLKETLEAFEVLAREDRELRFIFIGRDKYNALVIGPLIKDINARLQRPAVQHIERVPSDDLTRFYAGARAVTYVSDVEAFGLPPLEALAAGSIPVVLDTPINREIYADNTCYSKGTSAEAIGTALQAAMHDESLRTRIRAAAPATLARFTWKAHADRWLAIMKELTT